MDACTLHICGNDGAAGCWRAVLHLMATDESTRVVFAHDHAWSRWRSHSTSHRIGNDYIIGTGQLFWRSTLKTTYVTARNPEQGEEHTCRLARYMSRRHGGRRAGPLVGSSDAREHHMDIRTGIRPCAAVGRRHTDGACAGRINRNRRPQRGDSAFKQASVSKAGPFWVGGMRTASVTTCAVLGYNFCPVKHQPERMAPACWPSAAASTRAAQKVA
jgi:hypothetical protein